MERSGRFIVLLLFLAIAAWRLYRLLRLSKSRRASALGLAGGLIPADTAAGGDGVAAAVPGTKISLSGAVLAGVVAVLVWSGVNALIWAALLEVPWLKTAPPIPVGVVWIVANFYLIPMARRIGAYCVRNSRTA